MGREKGRGAEKGYEEMRRREKRTSERVQFEREARGRRKREREKEL